METKLLLHLKMNKINIILFCLAVITSVAQNVPPTLTAIGNQLYCPNSTLPIVTSFSITDQDDTAASSVYIQISSGYQVGQDLLELTGTHPAINSSWNATEGKLTLNAVSGSTTYTNFINAVQQVVFSSTAANPSGQRVFSISIGNSNYLQSTGHYYVFVPNIGISWTAARNAAAASTYYGLQGYLATITSMDEVQISTIQTQGAGWIGGSDAETEGVWKWVTGPEGLANGGTGTVFWNGTANGSTPNFAHWSNNEPNNQEATEDYAHVTAPGIGLPGSWNDLTLNGYPSGNYQPKGYIVEYGGIPGDPVINITATTTIIMPVNISSVVPATRCGVGVVTLQATAGSGTVNWYTTPTGGLPIYSGNSFTTPTTLTTTTTYYVDAYPVGCATAMRTMVTATINPMPITTSIITN
jgi:hypothetical protein